MPVAAVIESTIGAQNGPNPVLVNSGNGALPENNLESQPATVGTALKPTSPATGAQNSQSVLSSGDARFSGPPKAGKIDPGEADSYCSHHRRSCCTGHSYSTFDRRRNCAESIGWRSSHSRPDHCSRQPSYHIWLHRLHGL